MSLPPGPRLPGAVQTARFVRRPVSFIAECERRFGTVFTLDLPPVGRAVHLTSPEAAKAVFTRDKGST